jgi:hypothetical protein
VKTVAIFPSEHDGAPGGYGKEELELGAPELFNGTKRRCGWDYGGGASSLLWR